MINTDEIKCKADSIEYFKDEKSLLNLMKFNALYRIANCLSLFSLPKYKDYSLWEKFY